LLFCSLIVQVEEFVDYQTDSYSLTQRDWNLILSNTHESNTLTYNKNEIILKQGNEYRGIYQIVKGSCRIEVNDKVRLVWKLANLIYPNWTKAIIVMFRSLENSTKRKHLEMSASFKYSLSLFLKTELLIRVTKTMKELKTVFNAQGGVASASVIADEDDVLMYSPLIQY
jgi:hypothetical protein